MRRFFYFFISIIIIVSIINFHKTAKTGEISPFNKKPMKLKSYSNFNSSQIDESSGLVKSRFWKDVYWTHNDSGDKARIFPITKNGELIKSKKDKKDNGIKISDAVNIDWEDIATDNEGNLIIGACGNNNNARRDLAIYIIKDPYPFKTEITRVSKKISFYYPEQKTFPAETMNYDAEGIFCANGKIYLLTKHRSDTYTRLYRFDSIEPNEENPLTLIGEFDIKDKVTSADASSDGNILAVLTYSAIWLVEIVLSYYYFNGRILWLPISAGQCEGICIDGDNLLISNEEGELFEVTINSLIVIKE